MPLFIEGLFPALVYIPLLLAVVSLLLRLFVLPEVCIFPASSQEQVRILVLSVCPGRLCICIVILPGIPGTVFLQMGCLP